jgi:hypothetical protein
MKTYGPLYVGTLKYWHKKALPILEVGTTQETEMPYRKGKCLVFRLPFTHPGFYLGLFYKTPDVGWEDDDKIDEILFGAMKSRVAWKPEDGLYEAVFKEEDLD